MAETLRGPGADTQMHQALDASDQWQGRTINQDAAERMGLWGELSELS